MTARKRYRNPSPPRTTGPVPFEEVELTGRRQLPPGTPSVELLPAGDPPTFITLHPQGKAKELAAARRERVREALAQLTADHRVDVEKFNSLLGRWPVTFGDPKVWPALNKLLSTWSPKTTVRPLTWESHPVDLWGLLNTLGWRLAMDWCEGDKLTLRRAAEAWLVEHRPVIWHQLDDPAKQRVAELLHERLKLAEAEQRGHQQVLQALESFGRSAVK